MAIVAVPLALGCATTSAKMEIRIETDGTIRIVPFVDDRPGKKPGKWPNRPPLSL